MKKFIMGFCSLLYCCFAVAENPVPVAGTWNGNLEVQGFSLNVIFHITESEGIYAITLDVPQQGVKGIPAESTTLNGRELLVKIPVIQAEYKAEITNDTVISGAFSQGGASFPLSLKKQPGNPVVEVKANLPANVDAYTSKEVKFRNDRAGITLAGTLTYPKNKTNCPAVILLTGSGPQDRDETILEQKPFLRIADYLSSKGVAVLRFDDRGTALSEGDFKNATVYDFVTDALSAFRFLSGEEGIDKNRIGFIGHSEGANLGLMAAAENKMVAFTAMLGGISIPGDTLLRLQAYSMAKASGMSEPDLVKDNRMRNRIFNIIKNEPDQDQVSKDIAVVIDEEMSNIPESDRKKAADAFIQSSLSPWMRAFLAYDPAPYFRSVNCPVLVLYGNKDLQAPAPENTEALKKIISGKNNFTLRVLPGLNHMFQDAQTGLVSEYYNLEKPMMNDEMLLVLQDWITSIALK